MLALLDAHSEPSQISKLEFFANMLTVEGFYNTLNLEYLTGFEYTSAFLILSSVVAR